MGAASVIAQADELSNFRTAVRGEENLVVLVGNELRDGELARLISTLPNAKFACLADYANSRGASDMGLLPDLLPGFRIPSEWQVGAQGLILILILAVRAVISRSEP